MLPALAHLPMTAPTLEHHYQASEWKNMSFLASSLKLHGLGCDHISHLHGFNVADVRKTSETLVATDINMDHVSKLLTFESELLAWKAELPEALQMPPVEDLSSSVSSEQLPVLDRQAVVLRAR
ncbi:hypothetical protein LTR12_012409 [Friedmanniomyces endolithicus]|nr:hypothetical protein LTR74_017144 [Friedmanniomyces endolithicus]KAK1813220.1 hypothetical protein LTR12_012409 [Friedmanniomyces endolithicus]